MTTHGFRSEERLTAPTSPDFPEHKLPDMPTFRFMLPPLPPTGAVPPEKSGG
jgi:hypothetical protein